MYGIGHLSHTTAVTSTVSSTHGHMGTDMSNLNFPQISECIAIDIHKFLPDTKVSEVYWLSRVIMEVDIAACDLTVISLLSYDCRD